MKKILFTIIMLFSGQSYGVDFREKILLDYEKNIKPVIYSKEIIAEIKKANEKVVSEEGIKNLDEEWRSQIFLEKKDLINKVLNNKVSKKLKEFQQKAGGLYTEIFIMDNKGLNIAQSEITSDYWQGDEDKWQKTFLVGKDAYFVDEVEFDESAQVFHVQASFVIFENDKAIGAVTIGYNAEEVEDNENI